MRFSSAQEFIEEFLGTMVLLAFGSAVVAMVTLFPRSPAIAGEVIKGGYTNICLACCRL